MATLGGTDIGDVQTEQQVKDSGLFNQPLPTQDSDNTILLDLFGMTRTIQITGMFEGTEAAQRTFIAAMDTIAAGAQTGSAFVSGLITSPANRTVFIQNWSWTKSKADIRKIDYTLTLIEGATVA